ncbi:ImmA/IrrE family metallo-endopeptidase [Domibacillus sp. PGB-M46]|uniref:ImmA/IrrE family metallo-endopeptidase n=1 Tax=Domibacillus sp. PGB-M46 TaxID=2910255 RepID=UPI0035C8EA65
MTNQLNTQQKWKEFAHELCHFLCHAGNQETLPLPFIRSQEGRRRLFLIIFVSLLLCRRTCMCRILKMLQRQL